jgi:hypothetical protein
MEDNMESLFEDAVNIDAPAEEPVSDDGSQESNDTAEVRDAPKPEQTAQERARQAEGRRIRDREARAYKAARDEMSETLKRLGMTNPNTGEVITTIDELDAYEKSLSDERLENGNANTDDLRRIVREEMQASQPRQEPATLSADDRTMVDRQLAEIRQMDPEMKDLNAILQSEAGEKFRQYVEKGLDFVDAYSLAARDRLSAISENRAKRGTGKEHLSATSQRGSGALDVPADEMAIFKELVPGMSEADYQKYYNADRRRFGHK